MDRPDNSADDLRQALADIRRVNRWLGGRRAMLGALRPILASLPRDRPVDVLDVGTGSADLAIDIEREVRRGGRSARVVAIDNDPATAAIASRRVNNQEAIHVLRADAFAPPFAAGSFDLVTTSMFLHHFSHEQIVTLLTRFRSLARRAVVINDLRRDRLAWASIGLAARLFRCHPMFVHDAPLSVLRGFTPHELNHAAVDAGAPKARTRRVWPYRLVLTLPGGAEA